MASCSCSCSPDKVPHVPCVWKRCETIAPLLTGACDARGMRWRAREHHATGVGAPLFVLGGPRRSHAGGGQIWGFGSVRRDMCAGVCPLATRVGDARGASPPPVHAPPDACAARDASVRAHGLVRLREACCGKTRPRPAGGISPTAGRGNSKDFLCFTTCLLLRHPRSLQPSESTLVYVLLAPSRGGVQLRGNPVHGAPSENRVMALRPHPPQG